MTNTLFGIDIMLNLGAIGLLIIVISHLNSINYRYLEKIRIMAMILEIFSYFTEMCLIVTLYNSFATKIFAIIVSLIIHEIVLAITWSLTSSKPNVNNDSSAVKHVANPKQSINVEVTNCNISIKHSSNRHSSCTEIKIED